MCGLYCYGTGQTHLRLTAGEDDDSPASTMSQATKRKHVVQEVLGDFINPTGNQQIVKVNPCLPDLNILHGCI